jgi:hypothetical protein
MLLVPSHDFFLKNISGNPCPCSIRVISQTDRALAFVGPRTQRFPPLSCRTINPLANVIGHAIHSRATRRYL